MKTLITILMTLSSLSAFAADCNYLIKSNDVGLQWTAFKTPLKKGVSGTFKKYGIKKQYQGNSLKDVLTSVSFNIDTKSVYTKNDARDKKLVKFFFGLMHGNKISGKIQSYSKKLLKVQIKMNGVTKKVPLAVQIQGSQIEASGHIDILDFSMNQSLASINKACSELHQGKTWSDVDLNLSIKYSKTCK